jgi:predicted ATPase
LAAILAKGVNVHLLRREFDVAKERGAMALEVMREHGFSGNNATAALVDGWTAAAAGQVEEGIASLREGLAARRSAGITTVDPHALGYFIDSLARTNHADEGMTVLENAFVSSSHSGMTYWDAELHRLKGVLLLALSDGNDAEAEACFKQAIEIARGQSAKSFELRAAMELARLWQGQGKRSEARDLLAPVHDWFTEGFDTADLKDAKALLDDLT